VSSVSHVRIPASPSETAAQEVATRVRAALAAQGKSGRWLSEATGIPNASCARRLRGRYEFSISELHRVADALGVPLASLVDDQQRGSAA
jgi:ribosome-binding protein aMBF1 (putative translation factor)